MILTDPTVYKDGIYWRNGHYLYYATSVGVAPIGFMFVEPAELVRHLEPDLIVYRRTVFGW